MSKVWYNEIAKKGDKMKNRKSLFMFPSIFIFLLISIYPIIKILLDVKEIKNVYLSLGTILILLLLVLLLIVVFVEEIYLINYLWTKLKMNVGLKLLWTILLLGLNIIIIPYFYMRFVMNESKIILKSLIYLIPIIVFFGIFMFGYNKYTDKLDKKIVHQKKIDAERNEYKTKDGFVSFTFRHGFKKEEVGEYDLYVSNKSKNIIFSAYTYETFHYEQKTADDYITKGIADISEEKEKFNIFSDKKVIEKDDKIITTIEYSGKTKESSDCIYRISAISFKNKEEYIVYVVEIITENNYDLYKKEMLEILESAKI